jgi:hypothetical protein
MDFTTYVDDPSAHLREVIKHDNAVRQGMFLVMWAVFDSPEDMPGRIVVRANFSAPDGSQGVSPTGYLYDSLEEAREPMRRIGLTCIREQEQPPWVESWI